MAEKNLTGKQKAAAIIISLGAEDASKIYKFLKEDEIEFLTYEISRLEQLSPKTMEDTLKDFYDICLTQKVITEGGLEYAKNVLEKAFGAQVATNLMERATKTLRTKAFEFIRKADYKNLLVDLKASLPDDISHPLTFEVISHRYTIKARNTILEVFPESALPMNNEERTYKYGQFGYGKYVYTKEEINEIKSFFNQQINDIFDNKIIKYIIWQ